jgi:ATP synthase F1 delta subunit
MKSLNAKQFAVLLQQSLALYIDDARKQNITINTDYILANLLKALVPVVKNLEKTGKLKLFPEIIEEFEKLSLKSLKSETAFVYSSVALTDEQKAELKDKLTKLFRTEILIDNEVDATMSEGIIIKYKDTLIDGTVVTQLKKSLS